MSAALSFRIRDSKLVELFVERAGGSSSDPLPTLRRLLLDLRRTVGWTPKSPQLEKAQKVRRIFRTEYKVGWDRDGSLEPLGMKFDQGFRLTLNAKSPARRVRFTQAHELCHTYFYEYVPEIKFRPHMEDPAEERLCNFGAAELLMPEHSLRREIKGLRRSILSLLNLAAAYGVSAEAMMSRLRFLRLWTGELHIWQREASGDFLLDRMIGGNSLPWRWSDQSIPTKAWARGPISGYTYLEYEVHPGYKRFKPISFEAKHEGSTLMVLTGVSEHCNREEKPLLLRVP
jgi:Zn-dependent peptidase ImmA (M78 family)